MVNRLALHVAPLYRGNPPATMMSQMFEPLNADWNDTDRDAVTGGTSWTQLILAASFAAWMIVAIAGPYVFNGSSMAEAVVGIAVIVPFGAAIVTGAIYRAATAETALLSAAFVIPAAISTAVGYADILTVFAIAILPIYVLASAAMIEVPDDAMRMALKIAAVVTLITLVAGAISVHEERFFYGHFAAWERMSTGRHPNYAGLTALVGMIAAIAWRGVPRMALMVAFLWLTYLAQSRMTLICMLICIIAVAIETAPRVIAMGKRFPTLFPAAVAGGILTAGGVIFVVVQKLLYLSSLGGRDVSEMGGRTRIWSIALDTFAKSPWFGFGYRSQSTQNLLGEYYSHNMWLSSLVEIGAVGTLAFMAVYLAAIVIAVRNIRRGQVVQLCLIILLVYLVYGIAEGRYINTGNPLSVLFLFSVAYCFALHNRNRVERAEANEAALIPPGTTVPGWRN